MSEEAHGLSFSKAEREVLMARYSKLTDAEFEAFLDAARRYQLNPLANQIYARLQEQTQRNQRQITYSCQIDGYRLIAERTGKYAGNDAPVWEGQPPARNGEQDTRKATVTVWKIVAGQRFPFSAVAYWSEYCPSGNQAFMWEKMPHLMLGKCAEALALRKAFPAELAGLYTVEEMEQADDPPAGRSPAPSSKQENADAATAAAEHQWTEEECVEKIRGSLTAKGLSGFLLERLGKWKVAKNPHLWVNLGAVAKKRLEEADWPAAQKKMVEAALAAIRKQLEEAGFKPSAAAATANTPTAPAAEPPPPPPFERLAEWINSQESPADLLKSLNSFDDSEKFVAVRSSPELMLQVIRHAFKLSGENCAVSAWDASSDEVTALSERIAELEQKYDLSQQVTEAFEQGAKS